MTDLKLQQLNDNVHSVLAASGEHVGNLKRIGAIWKFKAIGYDERGQVEPGGGPLTHRHNLVIEIASEVALNSAMKLAVDSES